MSEKQRTLAKEVTLSGKGLHTGINVNITFKPAPANHGYKFCRSDLPGKPVIDALAENVTDTSRGTTLVQNNASVSTIEHALAALHGLQVDNALIDLNGPEAPIMGGSAWAFVKAIKEAGLVELTRPEGMVAPVPGAARRRGVERPPAVKRNVVERLINRIKRI